MAKLFFLIETKFKIVYNFLKEEKFDVTASVTHTNTTDSVCLPNLLTVSSLIQC